jgi:hypothetical protein
MAKQHYILHERHHDVESSTKIFKQFVNLKSNHAEGIELVEECGQQQQQQQQQNNNISTTNNFNSSNNISRYDTPVEYLSPLGSSLNSRSTIISPDYLGSMKNDFMEERLASPKRLVHADWGTAHPFYLNDSDRVKWSEQEIAYISRWCDYNTKAQPNLYNITAKCLEAIRRDPNALPIFHKRHIVDSGRLRVGYKHYLKLKMSQPNLYYDKVISN